MSNWNGVGTPENGQWLSAGYRSKVQFIGVNSLSRWVIEDENGDLDDYDDCFCKPIKTPEQVEEERVIDDIEVIILGNSPAYETSTYLAKALHKAGYHNQPKVKPISRAEFYDMLNGGMFKDFVRKGYIIEAKEEGSD